VMQCFEPVPVKLNRASCTCLRINSAQDGCDRAKGQGGSPSWFAIENILYQVFQDSGTRYSERLLEWLQRTLFRVCDRADLSCTRIIQVLVQDIVPSLLHWGRRDRAGP
jgi:hypothetical protein